jgi:hypothetical protein
MTSSTTVTVVLTLEGDGDEADLRRVASSLLDAEFFQNVINDCELQDEEGTEISLRVTSAEVLEDFIRCRRCMGDGLDDPRHSDRLCRACDGTGKVSRGRANYLGWLPLAERTIDTGCRACGGRGCPSCCPVDAT